jgi:hypothetical protein
MKLSKETLSLIKNFSSINSNLLFTPGNVLSTISTHKNVAAYATVVEAFPSEFGIYDLNEFLGAMALFTDPELEFKEKYVLIKEGNSSIKYYKANREVLVVAPENKINFPESESDIEFVLTLHMFNTIQKTASVLKVSDLSIVGDGNEITLRVGDKKNDTCNIYSALLGKTDKTFNVNLKVDNLKLVQGDYSVRISNKRISKFKQVDTDLVYFVAVESDSTFSE